ncbi:glycosyltransferase 1 domain-containing protein 1-like isoform X2 [Physella acuta]|uniref:glycosyltransferase 1 domain-containing protein 1-like isoform X2 n=1 Tax=Physella acuta TaxID=109671 RepID=UPI0027DC60CC|nr:glycosyltransferase 1 domain-containing protein 1-like isoform X2 [Physella acuta]
MDIVYMSLRSYAGMPHTLTLLSPLAKRGGNYCTIKRIRNHLKSHGYECQLEDPKLFKSRHEMDDILSRDSMGVLIGIHAYRTGAYMKDSNLPYIVILGGTDINEFSKDPEAMTVMTEVVMKAKFVVCFSTTIRSKALSLWPNVCHARLVLIPQAVHTSMSSFNLITYLSSRPEVGCLQSSSQQKPVIFVFIGGIRPVKNPIYLVSTFQEWHARDKRIILLIVGPKLDEQYCTKVFEPAISKHPGIVYIPGLPMEDTHAVMSQSFALVNSSDSEGMCLAILEAMQIGIPVFARNIPGNRAIIEDNVTGFLFDSPQTFLQKAESIVENVDRSLNVTKQAKEYILQHHNLESERKAYTDLLEQCITEIEADNTEIPKLAMSVTINEEYLATHTITQDS